MPRRELRDVLLTVADRFNFGERELWAMPISRLLWWYNGAIALSESEQRSMEPKRNG